jgi:hypothetical protein
MELTKLIEQYEQETGRKAREQWDNDSGITVIGSPTTDFAEWLASRPTCGLEQRRFLDELEKMYKFKDIGMGALIKKNNWRHYITEIMQKDFIADLSKVIKGE